MICSRCGKEFDDVQGDVCFDCLEDEHDRHCYGGAVFNDPIVLGEDDDCWTFGCEADNDW